MKTVVVGASSGLGRCIGIGLARRGAHVALLARRRDKLDDAAKEAGGETLAIACDVTDEPSCRAAIAEASAGLGGIDALVGTVAGILVPPRDVPALANALRRVITDKTERERFSDGAWAAGSTLPTWDVQAMRMAGLLSTV